MAKKSKATKKKTAAKVNKSAEIREYLASHPGVKPADAAAALTKKGVKVSAQYISVVKSSGKKKQGRPRVRPSVATKRTSDRISVDSIVKAKEFVVEVGGMDEARKAIDALAKLTD